MIKYVVFDVDGTLNQTDLYAVEAYQKALEKRGRKVTREEIISCIGMSPMSIVERLFGSLEQEELEEWRTDIREYEFALMKEKSGTFEGIKTVLEKLKEEGFNLAICSNAFREHIWMVLNAIGVWEYFDEFGSLEMGNDKSEILGSLIQKLKPDCICMVGDRMYDIKAARKNQIPVIGCAYGYAPEEIKEADIIVKTPHEILSAVHKLL